MNTCKYRVDLFPGGGDHYIWTDNVSLVEAYHTATRFVGKNSVAILEYVSEDKYEVLDFFRRDERSDKDRAYTTYNRLRSEEAFEKQYHGRVDW